MERKASSNAVPKRAKAAAMNRLLGEASGNLGSSARAVSVIGKLGMSSLLRRPGAFCFPWLVWSGGMA